MRAGKLRAGERAWHGQCKPQAVSRVECAPASSIHDLYVQLKARRQARERIARLAVCGLLPAILAALFQFCM